METKAVFLLVVGLAAFSLARSCPGCPMLKDNQDPEVHKYLTRALSNFQAAPVGTEDERIALIKINRAFSQVVTGIKYAFNFDAIGIKTSKVYECNLVIIEQPWLGGAKIKEFTCQTVDHRNNRK